MFDPAHLVFVDETAANTKMVRLSGRCQRGERLIGRVPQGHWKTITFVAALRRNGMRASCTVDGAMNGAKFLAYVKQSLAPTLKCKGLSFCKFPSVIHPLHRINHARCNFPLP